MLTAEGHPLIALPTVSWPESFLQGEYGWCISKATTDSTYNHSFLFLVTLSKIPRVFQSVFVYTILKIALNWALLFIY